MMAKTFTAERSITIFAKGTFPLSLKILKKVTLFTPLLDSTLFTMKTCPSVVLASSMLVVLKPISIDDSPISRNASLKILAE